MSDSDEPITRDKKPLSEARLAAIERMKEGRIRSLEAKKKQKEEEKEAKKQIKKKIKMKVEEEMNGLSSLPVDDKEFMENLRKKAVGEDKVEKVVKFDETKNEVKDIVGEVLKQQPFSSPTEPQSVVKDNEEDVINEVINEKKPRSLTKRPKKKVVVNNYYEDESESSSEEEIVNNYHKKKKSKKSKKKKKVQSSSSEEEEEVVEEYIEVVPEYHSLANRNYNPYTNAMAGISFR